MALDVAAGILIAGIVSGIFSVGVWMVGEGFENDQRGLTTLGFLLVILALTAAALLIAERALGIPLLAMTIMTIVWFAHAG